MHQFAPNGTETRWEIRGEIGGSWAMKSQPPIGWAITRSA